MTSFRRSTHRTAAAYDSSAEAYRDWWGPVIAGSALHALDRVAPTIDGRAATLLDIGTGSGVLAIEALRRWPRARVVGVDASAGMLDIARAAARREGFADRLQLHHGDGLALPLDDASVDAVVSSFVIQLTASRGRFLREAARVLRPGGLMSIVTWQVTDAGFPAAQAMELAFDEVDAPQPAAAADPRSWPSPAVARRELRQAGLVDAGAEIRWLVHPFTPESYVELSERWIADTIFGRMSDPERRRLREAALRRLRALTPEERTWRRPTVLAWGRRPRAGEGA